MGKKVVMVGWDIAPSNAFGMLGEALQEKGCEIAIFAGYGRAPEVTFAEVLYDVDDAAVVITGISSRLEYAHFEMYAMARAIGEKVPLIWYWDQFDTGHRPYVPDTYREHVDMIMLPDEFEAQEAEKHGRFPKANFVVTGNPDLEATAFPKYSREEVRDALGVTDDEFMVLVPAGKITEITLDMFQAVVKGCELFHKKGKKLKVFLCTHPGDENIETYFSLEEKSADGFVIKVRTRDDEPKTPALITGADGMLSYGSTMDITASYFQIPVITMMTPQQYRRYRFELTSGRKKWGPAEVGATYPLYNFQKGYRGQMSNFIDVMDTFFFGSGRAEMQEAQRKAYPRPTEPVVIGKMLKALEPYLS